MSLNLYCNYIFNQSRYIAWVCILCLSVLPMTSYSAVVFDATHQINDVETNPVLQEVLQQTMKFIEAGLIPMRIQAETTEKFAKQLPERLDTINKSINAYYTLVKDWQELTEPKIAGKYTRIVEKLNNNLEQIDSDFNRNVDNIKEELKAPLKENRFADAALNNTAEQYSKGSISSDYAKTIKNKGMCPDPAKGLVQNTSNESYAKLHQQSCLAMYDLTAYKKLYNQYIREKYDTIDKAIQDILDQDKFLKTMGDFNAKKDALITVRILQTQMMSKYQVDIEEINTRVLLAEKTRVYSGSAIVGGAPTNPGLTTAMIGIKMALGAGLTLTGVLGDVPYNQ